jgi:peroxiredoxin Q/BCP
MCSYRDDLAKFNDTGAILLGISPQDVESHERWADKKGFHFPLLADVDKKVVEAYGVGAPLIQVRRSVFVVDGEGVVRFSDRKLIGATFVPADKLVPVLASIG